MPTPTTLSASACLIDGTALFFAAKQVFPDTQLDYRALVNVLVEQFGPGGPHAGDAPLHPPGEANRKYPSRWIMFTAFSAANAPQSRFLDFVRSDLGFEVRKFAPADGLVIDRNYVRSGEIGSALADRLTRFDASIAFTAARLGETHRLIVVSDSFPLAEPLVRAARLRSDRVCGHPSNAPNAVAFFGRALDPRWHTVPRSIAPSVSIAQQIPLVIFDLESRSDALAGAQSQWMRDWFAAAPDGTEDPN